MLTENFIDLLLSKCTYTKHSAGQGTFLKGILTSTITIIDLNLIFKKKKLCRYLFMKLKKLLLVNFIFTCTNRIYNCWVAYICWPPYYCIWQNTEHLGTSGLTKSYLISLLNNQGGDHWFMFMADGLLPSGRASSVSMFQIVHICAFVSLTVKSTLDFWHNLWF